jgi:hypothetical protein
LGDMPLWAYAAPDNPRTAAEASASVLSFISNAPFWFACALTDGSGNGSGDNKAKTLK